MVLEMVLDQHKSEISATVLMTVYSNWLGLRQLLAKLWLFEACQQNMNRMPRCHKCFELLAKVHTSHDVVNP